MAGTETMVLVFGFTFPFSTSFQGKMLSASGNKWGFSFWLSFGLDQGGWDIFARFDAPLTPETATKMNNNSQILIFDDSGWILRPQDLKDKGHIYGTSPNGGSQMGA